MKLYQMLKKNNNMICLMVLIIKLDKIKIIINKRKHIKHQIIIIITNSNKIITLIKMNIINNGVDRNLIKIFIINLDSIQIMEINKKVKEELKQLEFIEINMEILDKKLFMNKIMMILKIIKI